MLRIRLTRTGKKGQPSYRIVVADVRSKRDGRVVERIGHYNPLTDPAEYKIKEGRALHWLSVGAQPSNAVHRLLEKQGTIQRLQRLRGGESLEQLVADFEGAPAGAATAEIAQEEEAVDEAVVAQAGAAVSADEEE
jgi:small subunit ribosomal protein S16